MINVKENSMWLRLARARVLRILGVFLLFHLPTPQFRCRWSENDDVFKHLSKAIIPFLKLQIHCRKYI